jgi:hypothetical protein
VRGCRSVATGAVGVAAQLARDCRRRAPQPPRDRAHRFPARASQRDLLALGERQAATPEIAPAAWAHATAGGHPARALLAVGARLHGGVSDELAGLQRRPERLHHLRHLGVDEPRHPVLPTSKRRAGHRSAPATPATPRARRSAAPARPPGSPPRRPTRTPSSAPDGSLSDGPTASCCDHRENPRILHPPVDALTGRVRAAPTAGSRPPARLECAARPARGWLAHQSGGVRGRQEMGAGRASTCWPATFAERIPASVPELQWLGRRSCWRRSAGEHGARAQAGPRAASTASRTRSGPKRITSSATTPQACSVAASSAWAARSSSAAVLSATAATRAGRTGRQTAS